MFNGPSPGLPRRASTRKVKPIWILLKQETVAVASAGPYASLHLTPDRQPRQHPTTQFFTGRMPFLPPNQQCQSTEGTNLSHARMVVRECCKGDDESQWVRGKFDPPPPKNPLTDGHQNLCR